jgi:hypothetical protein
MLRAFIAARIAAKPRGEIKEAATPAAMAAEKGTPVQISHRGGAR